MNAYTRLEAAAREFTAAAAFAADDAHWEDYGVDGTPDYPHSRADLGDEDGWMPTREYVVELLSRVQAATKNHLKLLERPKGSQGIVAPDLGPLERFRTAMVAIVEGLENDVNSPTSIYTLFGKRFDATAIDKVFDYDDPGKSTFIYPEAAWHIARAFAGRKLDPSAFKELKDAIDAIYDGVQR